MRRITSRLDEKDYMLELAVYNIHKEIVELAMYRRNELMYGHECLEDKSERLKTLCMILPLLEDEQIITDLGGGCLTLKEAECFISKHVVLFEEGARVDLEKDTSDLALWIALNPDSVPRQKWEEAASNVAYEYELILNVRPVACEYALYSEADKLDCEIVDEFVAVHKECNYKIETLSFQEQCAYEFDMLKNDEKCEVGFEVYRNINNCELDLEQYVNMKNCDLDLSIIRTVLAAGCTINVGEL